MGLLDVDSKYSSTRSQQPNSLAGDAKSNSLQSAKQEASKGETATESSDGSNAPKVGEPKTISTKLEPLSLKPLPSMRAPLPAINSGSASLDLQETLDSKKRITENVIKKNQDQLAAQRRQEDNLRQQISGIDPEEAEKRAAYMREQRDRLIAAKKEERERKVQIEAERKAKVNADADVPAAVVHILQAENASSSNSPTKKDNKADNDILAEQRRDTLRNTLARRMKMDLLQTEGAKMIQAQDEQFSELDRRLQMVDQLREDNRKREYILNKQIEKQKAQVAKNIELSASALRGSDAFDA
jgi:hypothetical protein